MKRKNLTNIAKVILTLGTGLLLLSLVYFGFTLRSGTPNLLLGYLSALGILLILISYFIGLYSSEVNHET